MRTKLFEKHMVLGAKMISFSGWEMPLFYSGILQEHHAVRTSAGIFDVSHMGRIEVTGKDAALFLDHLSTNHLLNKKELTATYTVWCNGSGGSLEDLIIYKITNQHCYLICNASNRQKVLQHLLTMSQNYNVAIVPKFEGEGILALQGPNAEAIAEEIFPEVASLKPMQVIPISGGYLSKTGYTGSGGIEIVASDVIISKLWDQFMDFGKSYGLLPCGLGARDTLRLEMGYALYGHELDENIAPTETVSRWTVKWDKEEFVGKEALLALENSPQKRSEHGVILLDKGIAREGYPVRSGNVQIGRVTSGTMAPSLNKAVAIILTIGDLSIGDIIEIQVRERWVKAEVVQLPFYRIGDR